MSRCAHPMLLLLVMITVVGFSPQWGHWRSKDSCSDRNSTCLEISGELSREHVARVESKGKSLTRIIVNSPGGSALVATRLSKAIYELNIELEIRGECSSACPAYLMPAARKIIVNDHALIALHRSDFSMEELFRRSGFMRPASCPWISRDWLRELYEVRDLDPALHLVELEKLGQTNFVFQPDENGCPRIYDYSTEFEFWLIDRDTLQRQYGDRIEFLGSLCVEEDQCPERLGLTSYAK